MPNFLDTIPCIFSNVSVSKIGVYFPLCMFTVPFHFCLKNCSWMNAFTYSPWHLHIRRWRTAASLGDRSHALRAASPEHQHLPWLWRRRGRRSSGGIAPLPPGLLGRPCAGPSPHAARKQRPLSPKQTHRAAWHMTKMCFLVKDGIIPKGVRNLGKGTVISQFSSLGKYSLVSSPSS